MKLVIGIVRPEQANDVLEALYRAEVRGLSLSRVQGHGGELERVETYRGTTVQMGLSVESSSAFAFGAAATLRAPHGGPEMLGWAADAVARALSACGHAGGVQIRACFEHASV